MNTYDPFARYYDADFASYVEDISFYRELVRRTGGPILELMCGTGRVLLPLAEDGYAITGVDISSAMLAVAQEKLAEAGLLGNATLVQGDVCTVELPRHHFAFAFVAVNSFMHLERVKDQLAALNNIHQALTRKGILVLDLFHPDPLQMTREDNRLLLERTFEFEGCQVEKMVAIESDPARQMSYVTYFYDETDSEGRVTRRVMRFTMRWFYRYELEHLLARAGFTIRSMYGSYDLDDYTSESQRLIVVAAPSSR